MMGRHLIKSWSSTQTSVSLSSGEAEYYGVVKASGIALGFQSLLRDEWLAPEARAVASACGNSFGLTRQSLSSPMVFMARAVAPIFPG